MHVLSLLGLVLSAHADVPSVTITSFYYTNQLPDRTAEICGTLMGGTAGAERVVITVDPGDKAGTYVAWPGPDGHWCALVNTLSGHATAGPWSGGATVPLTGGASADATVR